MADLAGRECFAGLDLSSTTDVTALVLAFPDGDRYDVLLISDEVICAFGRLGHYFGCQRYDYQPDIITMAKALTSAYVPMGGMLVSDRVYEPFGEGTAMFTHGFTFGGFPPMR